MTRFVAGRKARYKEDINMPEEAKKKTPKNIEDNKQEEQKSESKAMFTRDDISKLVSEQLSAKKAEWQKEMDEAVAKAKQDGKDEATMTAKELADKHAKEREAELEKKNAELDKRFAELERRDRLSKARTLLSQNNLPTDAAKLLVGNDDKETESNVQQYKALVDQGVKNAIHRNSAQAEPQNGGSGSDVPNKKFSEMTLDEQTELYRKNPELYAQLSQQN